MQFNPVSTPDNVLSDFYEWMNEWLDQGCPEPPTTTLNVPNQYTGLCGNLTAFLLWVHPSTHDTPCNQYSLRSRVRNCLGSQFVDKGLDPTHPFNKSGVCFRNESDSGRMYKNKGRVAWVREHRPVRGTSHAG